MLRVIIPLLLVVTGCGPHYQTFHTFTPPKSQSGKNCVNRCLENKQGCELQAQRNYNSCVHHAKSEAQNRYALYLAAQVAKKTPSKDIQSFEQYSLYQYNSCSDKITLCASSYRSCYSNCGGHVHSKEVKVNWLGQPIK